MRGEKEAGVPEGRTKPLLGQSGLEISNKKKSSYTECEAGLKLVCNHSVVAYVRKIVHERQKFSEPIV